MVDSPDRFNGMMADEFDATRWNEDLSEIAVDFSRT